MSEQQREQNSPKPNEPTKLDASTAAAALALAVKSAEKASGKHAEHLRKKAVLGFLKHPSLPLAGARKPLMQAAAVAVAIGLVWAGGSEALSGGRQALQAVPGWAEAAASSIRQNNEDIVRLTGDVRALKDIIESFRESFDHAKIETAGQSRPLVERLEEIERANQDATAKIVRVLEASDRIERAGTTIEAKLAHITGRLDGIERQAAAKPNQAAAADGPAQTGSVPDPKVAAKHAPIEGWILREVYDGAALVEARNGRLHEVVPGQTLPSVGRVEAIERRGKTWVVVTSKGFIGVPERWQ